MKIQLGDILIGGNGARYRVVEHREGVVSLIRLNGYTLFSCKTQVAEFMFQVNPSFTSVT